MMSNQDNTLDETS